MNKATRIRTVLWVILVACGAGLGIGIGQLSLPLVRNLWPQTMGTTSHIYGFFAALALAGALVFGLLGIPLRNWMLRCVTFVEQRWDQMDNRQILSRALSLVCALLLAFLCSMLLMGAGQSLLSFSLSALIYVLFGYMGIRLGDRRFRRWKQHSQSERKKRRLHESLWPNLFDTDEADAPAAEAETPETPEAALPACPKLLDSSVIIDGRLLPLYSMGLLEGQLVVPSFVLTELQQLSDSADDTRRLRGRRGLDRLAALKQAGAPVHTPDIPLADGESVDTALLRTAAHMQALLLSNDTNLCKVAAVAGVRTLSLFALFHALRLSLSAGDVISAAITREGKEVGQGVAYLEDGTMLVVEGGRAAIGQTVPVTVTSVLQTSAGRMVFARLEQELPNGA